MTGPDRCGDDYGAAHRLVARRRGRAAGQVCAECGRPARYWCYDGRDPAERRDSRRGRPYSLDPGRYRARCPSCHATIAAGHAPLTAAATDRLVVRYAAGASMARLAAETGVTRPALRAALTAAGVAVRARRSRLVLAPTAVDDLAARYRAGASLRALADTTGLRVAVVRAVLVERGVAIRGRAAAVEGAAAVALYRSGRSLRAVAAELGVGPAAIRSALVAAGVTIRPPRSAAGPVDEQRVASLYRRGASLRGIAALLGVTRRAARAALDAHGVPVRAHTIRPGRRPRPVGATVQRRPRNTTRLPETPIR